MDNKVCSARQDSMCHSQLMCSALYSGQSYTEDDSTHRSRWKASKTRHFHWTAKNRFNTDDNAELKHPNFRLIRSSSSDYTGYRSEPQARKWEWNRNGTEVLVVWCDRKLNSKHMKLYRCLLSDTFSDLRISKRRVFTKTTSGRETEQVYERPSTVTDNY